VKYYAADVRMDKEKVLYRGTTIEYVGIKPFYVLYQRLAAERQ
jgi:hypothetical protein